jgi:hypothetical protein
VEGGGQQLGDGLVAGRREQEEEGADVVVRQPRTDAVLLDLHLGEAGHHVVARPGAPLGDLLLEVAHHLHRCASIASLASASGCRPRGGALRSTSPAPSAGRLGHAEHRRDDVHRQARGELPHDVEARPPDQRIEVRRRDAADRRLASSWIWRGVKVLLTSAR